MITVETKSRDWSVSVTAMFQQLPVLTWNGAPLRKEKEDDTYVDARIDDIANYPGPDRVITVPAIEDPHHDAEVSGT